MNGGHLLLAVDGIVFGMVLYCVAAGFTLCYAAAVLNLAHGTVFAIGTYSAAAIVDGTWAGLGRALVVGALAGLAAGSALVVLLRSVRRPLDQALATIGASLGTGFLLTKAFGAQPLPVNLPPVLQEPVTLPAGQYPGYRLALAFAATVLAAGLYLVVHRARIGRMVRAAADNPRLLSLQGIDPRNVVAAVLIGASILATMAGTLASGLFPAAPGIDHRIMVLSLVIAIAGGAGSLRGALLAALAVGQMQTTAVAWWPESATILPYLLLVAVLAVTATWRHRQPGRLRP